MEISDSDTCELSNDTDVSTTHFDASTFMALRIDNKSVEMDDKIFRTEDVEIKDNISFGKMMLSDAVLTGLTKNNFKNPSPIQLKAIPLGRCGMDLLIKSKSGTGKTLVFCTIALERYNVSIQAPQTLIIVPTREVALQIETCLNAIGASCKGFKAVSVIGGRDICEDRRRLIKSTTIVATLGRLLHLVENCVISLKEISLVVLDEADKLITSDFRSNIEKLFRTLSVKPQVIACSATYADGLDKLLLKYMKNPAAVSATSDRPTLIGIKQFIHSVTEGDNGHNEAATPAIKMMMCKVDAVENILKRISFKQCILFSNSQMRAESFFSYLKQRGWEVDLIIGSHEQHLRTSTFQRFREFESRILIASDVMARGVDVENVNLVINLDMTTDSSTYLHRIGRCGRFGTYGIAITLISDRKEMDKFEQMLGSIGADGAKFSILNLNSELDEPQPSDFPNAHNEDSVFGEIDASIDLRDLSNIKRVTSPVKIESSQVCPQNKNMELLQLSKLMLDHKPGEHVKVDLDLFADYTNCNDAHINGTKTTKRECTISSSDSVTNRVFLQAMKRLEVSRPLDVADAVTVESPTKPDDVTERSIDNSSKIPTVIRKIAPKKHERASKSRAMSQQFWESIYWQQYNQINQYYVHWMKRGFP